VTANQLFWACTLNTEYYGDLLFPRLAEGELVELVKGLPRAILRAYAPGGFLHPVRLDAHLSPEPLGIWSAARVARNGC
jgi:hypothetical protein